MFKPGYFENSYGYSWRLLPIHIISERKEIALHKMTHYLNYLYYKDSRYSALYTSPRDLSESYKARVSKMNHMKLDPADDMGIFLRLSGRKLSRIYKVKGMLAGYFGNDIYYFLDDVTGEWVTTDSRGKILDLNHPNLPKCDFMIGDWDYPIHPFIYANPNTIFYRTGKEIPGGAWGTHGGEIKRITPCKGNISEMRGSPSSFFTIEENGAVLCHYGMSDVEESLYKRKSEGEKNVPYFLKSYSVNDFPLSKEDGESESFQFKYLLYNHIQGHFLVVARSRIYWHLYRLFQSYDKESGSVRLFIKALTNFPVEREITAIEEGWGGLYIAFKNDGIRKYHTAYYETSKDVFKEDSTFFSNSKRSLPSRVSSILSGYAGNIPAIYVTGGEDKIYRFSEDGIPDFIVGGLAGLHTR